MAEIYFDESNYPRFYIEADKTDLLANITDASEVRIKRIFNRYANNGHTTGEISTVSEVTAVPENATRIALYIRDLSVTDLGATNNQCRVNCVIDIFSDAGGTITSTNDVSWAPDALSAGFMGVINDGQFWTSVTARDLGATICDHTSSQVLKSFGEFTYKIDTNIPIFTSYEKVRSFITTGEDLTYAINYGGGYISPDVVEPYYIGGRTLTMVNGDTSVYDSNPFYWYRVPYGKKLYGYVTDNVPYNIRLVTDATSFWYCFGETEPTEEEWVETSSFPMNNRWTYEGHPCYDPEGNYYIGSLNTNIPILANKETADKYVAGEIDRTEIPGNRPGISGGGQITPTGSKSRQQHPEEASIANVMSAVYYGSAGIMSQIANTLYSTETSVVEQIKAGLEMYGQNPINFVLDCYYTPLDPAQFCTPSSQNYVMFGGYRCELTASINRVSASGTIKRLFNEHIYPLYEDFRQYMNVSYRLYLPYVGIVDLDTAIVTGANLTADCVYDLRTHNLKYYINADGKLIGEYEASLGVQLPLTGSDYAGKAQQNIAAISGLTSMGAGIAAAGITGGASMAGEGFGLMAGTGVTSAGKEAIAGFAGDPSGPLSAVQNLTARPAMINFGNSSSSTACFDPSYAFLIIDEVMTEEPEKLHATYGIPCDRIAPMGQSSGFTQVEDIRVRGAMTEEEKREIENLCRIGIII